MTPLSLPPVFREGDDLVNKFKMLVYLVNPKIILSLNIELGTYLYLHAEQCQGCG